MLAMVHKGSPITLMGSGEIQSLQQALNNLAIVTQRPQYSMGVPNGTVDDATMLALSNAFSTVATELPTTIATVLQIALAAGSTTATAKQQVSQQAQALTVAIRAAALKYGKAPSDFSLTPVTGGLFGPGWYKTPFGIGVIALSLLIGYKLFLAKKAS